MQVKGSQVGEASNNKRKLNEEELEEVLQVLRNAVEKNKAKQTQTTQGKTASEWEKEIEKEITLKQLYGTSTEEDDAALELINQRREQEKEKKTALAQERERAWLREEASKNKGLDFFSQGDFEDGWEWSDIPKTILGTVGDLGLNIIKGAGRTVEGVGDLVLYAQDALETDANKRYRQIHNLPSYKDIAQKDIVGDVTEGASNFLDKHSVLGETSDAIGEGVGQIGSVMLTGGIAGAAGAGSAAVTGITSGLTGASSMGSGMSEAYQSGATDGEAWTYGLISGAADTLTEMLFGGMGKTVNALGFNKGLLSADDLLAKTLTSKIKNTLAKNAVQFGIKASGEGAEEVLAGLAQAVGKKLTYMSEEDIGKIIEDENLLEQFIVGAATSGIAQGGQFISTTKKGQDFITGLTANEQKVYDKLYEERIAEAEKNGEKLKNKDKEKIKDEIMYDMENGDISTDLIEELLGGDTYKKYTDTVKNEDAVKSEYEEIGNIKRSDLTPIQEKRLAELEKQMEESETKKDRDRLRSLLTSEVMELTKKDRLSRSFSERDLRTQRFADDVSKYDNENAKKTAQNLLDSNLLNNSRRTRELANHLTSLSRDRGVTFRVTNNKQLKESGISSIKRTVTLEGNGTEKVFNLGVKNIDSGFKPIIKAGSQTVSGYKVDYENGTITFENAPQGEISIEYRKDAFVNGYYDNKNGEIVLNIDSPKVWQATVGHEVMHSLEGTKEGKKASEIIEAYAKQIGDYDERLSVASNLYKNSDADVRKEVVADLVGEYLFTDEKFVNHLYTQDKNVFQKVWNEIKYLAKVVTAGSKEARLLVKAQNAFEKAYKAGGKSAETNTSHSLSDSLGRQLTTEQENFLKDTVVRDENGNPKVMYHGTSNGGHTVFDTYGSNYGLFGTGSYFTDSKEIAESYTKKGKGNTPQVYETFLNIKNPIDMDAQADPSAWKQAMPEVYFSESGTNEDFYRAMEEYFEDNEYSRNEASEAAMDALESMGYDGITHIGGGRVNADGKKHRVYIAFHPEQIKDIGNENPTNDPDIRYSITEYTDEEKKAHNQTVLEHFGKTYKWAETGYLLLDGTKLDLSGKHDGAPGGYRTVDHRDITEALGYDYGGGEYSDSLIQFMSEGNIRIIPEINGINLSVMPTKAQEQALSEYISRFRGEVVLDIDNTNGQTVASVEYPVGTRATKVLSDIREWFENGKHPESQNGSQFQYSLSDDDVPGFVFEQQKSNKPIDKYSQKQYNDFGWARDAGAITKNELDDMRSKVYIKGSLKKFPQSKQGEAIVEVHNGKTKLETNNVLVFVTGTKNNPKISRIIRINAEAEMEADILRKDIYANTSNRALETYAESMGDELVRYYDGGSWSDYRKYKEKTRSRRSGSESEGNTPAYRNGDQRDGAFGEAQANDIAPTKEASSEDGVFFDGKKYSLSEDNQGKELTEAQADFFKNSKMRDENGNLKVMYHGTQDGGFHTFVKDYSDDGTSFFFVDSNDVAFSYSGTSETYAARTFHTANDFNNFFAEIGAEEYSVEQKDGKFVLYDDGDSVAESDTAEGIYEEFKDWSGLGYGEVNYEVYLNLENPLEVDAQGREWNELRNWSKAARIKAEDVEAKRVGDYFRLFDKNGSEIENAEIAVNQYNENYDLNSLRSIMVDKVNSILSIKTENLTTTRDVSKWAKKNGYDGVIFKNIYDIGGYGGTKDSATVAIAFNSNQIKSTANASPTSDSDIRLSLSDADDRQMSFGNFATPMSDLRYEGDDIAPLRSDARSADVQYSVGDELPSMPEDDAATGERLSSLTDEDMPPVKKNDAPKTEELPRFQNESNIPSYADNQIAFYKDAIAEERATVKGKKKARGSVLKRLVSRNSKGALGQHGALTVDGKQYFSVDGFVIAEMNTPDETITENDLLAVDKLKQFFNSATQKTLSDNYGIDPVDISLIKKQVPKGEKSVVLVGDSAFDIQYVDAVLKAIENPTLSLGSLNSKYKTLVVNGSNGRAIIAPVRVGDGLRYVYKAEKAQEMFPDEYAPMAEDESATQERLASITEDDVPPIPENVSSDREATSHADPFYDRDIYEVGRRNVKAFMFEHPDVKPFFQSEANVMLGELRDTVKGERIYQEDGSWTGTSRHTSDDIVYLRDELGYSYAEIEKGLNAIIEDNGKENIAVAKRIEFLLNDRLSKGYTDFATGMGIPANQDYLNTIDGMYAAQQGVESLDGLVNNADQYAPAIEDAPLATETREATVDNTAKQKSTVGKFEGVKRTAPRQESGETKQTGGDGKEERSWIGTSTGSKATDGKISPDDIDPELRYYQPISNKKTLGNANARLDKFGFDDSLKYFNQRFEERQISLDDIALGERLIQEAVKSGNYQAATDLITDISVLGTELGQKVQALSIIRRLTPEGQLRALDRVIQRGKAKGDRAFDGVELTQEQKERILKTRREGKYDQAELDAVMEDVKQEIADTMKSTLGEKADAWRYLAMLGNPKTHLRNIISNVAMKGTMAVKNIEARVLERIILGKGDASKAEAYYTAKAKAESKGDSVAKADRYQERTKTFTRPSKDVKDFANQQMAEFVKDKEGVNKYNDSFDLKQRRKIFESKVLSGINVLADLNNKALTNEDLFFSKSAYKRSLAEFLTANGIRTQEDIKNHPRLVERAKMYATEQANIATFQQYSYIARKLSEIENSGAVGKFIVGSTMPFKTTPINVAKAGLSYSPIGLGKTLTVDLAKVTSGKMQASTFIDNLCQGFTGSALMLLGYALAMSGTISGGGSDDKEEKYEGQLGEQSYSLNIGDQSFSLSWLSPVAMPLFVGANAYETLTEQEEWNGNVVLQTLTQTLDPLNEMSFLSGLTSTLSSYKQGLGVAQGVIESMAQSYVTQFAPTALSQVAATIDDTKRSTKAPADSEFALWDSTINKLKYKIPWLRQTLEPSLDIWGNEIKQNEDIAIRALENFISPANRKSKTETAIDQEIKSIYGSTGDGGILPKTPNASVSFDDIQYKMSASDYTAFKKQYGQTAYNMLGELFATDTYQEASPEEQAAMISRVYDYARDVSKKDYLANQGVEYTNTTKDGVPIYRDDYIKGAIENDMPVDEFIFFSQYPEKHKFFEDIGITYEQYQAADDDGKEAYSWAYNNPEKYEVSKAVSDDVVTYREYAKYLNNIRADKDENGKTISGSAKEKKIEYINGLDLDYGQKVILYKTEYKSDHTYNNDIIEYLNGRDDISGEQMVTILEELGFVVKNGYIYWRDSDGNLVW